jgi:hypothetical protein
MMARFSDGAGEEGGDEVGAEVDGVEDDIDVGVGMMYGLVLEWGLEFVLVMEVAQVGRCVQVGFTSWGGRGQVGVFMPSGVVSSWFPSFDGVSLPTTSRGIHSNTRCKCLNTTVV